jgi:hypothetical protein
MRARWRRNNRHRLPAGTTKNQHAIIAEKAVTIHTSRRKDKIKQRVEPGSEWSTHKNLPVPDLLMKASCCFNKT